MGKGTGREKIRGRGNGRGIYTVPFALRYGHYDLAGIRLTSLVNYTFSGIIALWVHFGGDVLGVVFGYTMVVPCTCDHLTASQLGFNHR